jgi:hypothetical protein
VEDQNLKTNEAKQNLLANYANALEEEFGERR